MGSIGIGIIVLVLVAMGFAWNLGVHYTGAVMGMPLSGFLLAFVLEWLSHLLPHLL